MGGYWAVPRAGILCMLGGIAASCASPPPMDLSRNPQLYRTTGYTPAVPADRAAFVAPVADARAATPAEAARGAPTTQLEDGSWERTPAQMVDAIVRDELRNSRVFAAIVPAAAADSCVVQVSLTEFDAGIQEQATGRRSFGGVVLDLAVRGPVDSNGGRPLLLEKNFAERLLSDIGMRPPSPRVLLGGALRRAMQRLLAAIDQSNLARSTVPPAGQ